MATSLNSLSADIIDLILGYDDTSYLSLQLYLVGNASLQLLLEQGVSYVELRDYSPFSTSRLPKYLTKLRSLRHLIIDRTDVYDAHSVYDLNRSIDVIGGLPEAMESLVLRFLDSSSIFDPPTALPPGRSPISVASKFPSLRCLRLGLRAVLPAAVLSQLPSTITDLQLQLPDSDDDANRELIAALPPSLIRLTLHHQEVGNLWLMGRPSILAPLPPQLVYLRVHIEQSVYALHKKYVVSPKELTRMQLPPSLTSVDMTVRGPFSFFPQGRLILDMDYPPVSTPQQHFYIDWSSSCGPIIPPFMSSICIPYMNDKKPLNAIAALPAHLEALGLDALPTLEYKHIRALPRRLTCLRSSSSINTKQLKVDDFPSTLRKLSVDKFNKGMSPVSAALLPPLDDLFVNSTVTFNAISHLPRTLTRLKLSVDELDGDAIWPPNLRTLSFSGILLTKFGTGADPKKAKKIKLDPRDYGTVRVLPPPGSCVLTTLQLSTLPRALTSLRLASFAIPMSQLLSLPPHLLHLELDYVIEDAQFDASSTVALSRARDLLSMEGGNEDYDFCLLSQQPQVTIFDLMPRSLTDLTYYGHCACPEIAWSRLPRNLASLSISPRTEIHGDVLIHIPKNRLKTLVVNEISRLEGAHIKALPKNMKRIDLHLFTIPALSADAAADAPLALQLHGPNLDQSPFWPALNARRSALAADLQALLVCTQNAYEDDE